MRNLKLSGFIIYCTTCGMDTDHHVDFTMHDIKFNPERHILTTVYRCQTCGTRERHQAIVNYDQNVIDDEHDS